MLLFRPSTGPSVRSGGMAPPEARPNGVGVHPENFRMLVRPNIVNRPEGFQLTFTSVEWRSNSATPDAKKFELIAGVVGRGNHSIIWRATLLIRFCGMVLLAKA